MSLFGAIKSFVFFGRSARLRVYEAACLDAWRKLLSAEGAAVFDRQIQHLIFLQRLSSDKLLTFHLAKGAALPPSSLFPNRADELVAAVIEVRQIGGGGAVKVRIILHQGKLSSLEFKEDPARVGLVGSSQAEILSAKSVGNPMQQTIPQNVTPSCRVQQWRGCLQALSAIAPVDECFPGASDDVVRTIAEVHSGLPREYFDTLSQTNGARIGRLWILPAGELRNIVLSGYDLCVLAEIDDDCLCVDEADLGFRLIMLRNGDPIPVKSSFCDALVSELLRPME